MPRIRLLEISNFRGVRELVWAPRPGVNALVGPGDAGKSTVLEAIDYCLGARRALTFSDADFYGLDTAKPICIRVTIGDLPSELLSVDPDGMFLRGFSRDTGVLEDEPNRGLETVLTVQLLIDDTLEPSWTMFSERAEAAGQQRQLAWGHRVRLAPVRLGVGAAFHLAWRQGSLLSRLTPDLTSLSGSLATAAREARKEFGEHTPPSAKAMLADIRDEAISLGINVGSELKAMLDADSVSFSRGTVSLHNNDGIPLQGLGTGSLRLLVVALQRKLATGSSIVLVDEVEYGLEPHRICRLLDALGAKESAPHAQVFLTTHSPVAVRELSSTDLFVLRETTPAGGRACVHAGDGNGIQGPIRTCPEAVLGRVVISCEGASEVGLLRGLDQYHLGLGNTTMASRGVVFLDADGEAMVASRAVAFQSLGFETAVLRDDDVAARDEEARYVARGGRVFKWAPGQSLEDALFSDLPAASVLELLQIAVEENSETLVNEHIKSVSKNTCTLDDVRTAFRDEHRPVLGAAANRKNAGWFKQIGKMERAARDVVGPSLSTCTGQLPVVIDALRTWAHDASA